MFIYYLQNVSFRIPSLKMMQAERKYTKIWDTHFVVQNFERLALAFLQYKNGFGEVITYY